MKFLTEKKLNLLVKHVYIVEQMWLVTQPYRKHHLSFWLYKSTLEEKGVFRE